MHSTGCRFSFAREGTQVWPKASQRAKTSQLGMTHTPQPVAHSDVSSFCLVVQCCQHCQRRCYGGNVCLLIQVPQQQEVATRSLSTCGMFLSSIGGQPRLWSRCMVILQSGFTPTMGVWAADRLPASGVSHKHHDLEGPPILEVRSCRPKAFVCTDQTRSEFHGWRRFQHILCSMV